MHELQQLDGELDVAQPAGTELELAPGLLGGQRLLHPAPHGLHVLDEMLAAGRLPDQRAEGVGYAWPSVMSPATGLALSSAWNSQVLAQRS